MSQAIRAPLCRPLVPGCASGARPFSALPFSLRTLPPQRRASASVHTADGSSVTTASTSAPHPSGSSSSPGDWASLSRQADIRATVDAAGDGRNGILEIIEASSPGGGDVPHDFASAPQPSTSAEAAPPELSTPAVDVSVTTPKKRAPRKAGRRSGSKSVPLPSAAARRPDPTARVRSSPSPPCLLCPRSPASQSCCLPTSRRSSLLT